MHLDPRGLDICPFVSLQNESLLMIHQGLSENGLQLNTSNVDALSEVDR